MKIIKDTEFIHKAKSMVKDYAIEHLDKSDIMPDFDVFVVWQCKALQNFKALLSTTLFDGMYYEITYNGDKDEIYFDAYKKFENFCIQEVEKEDTTISDTMFNWISVKDKLPPLNKDVLVCLGPNFQVVAQLTENKVWAYGLYAQETDFNGREYWMNLPSEPGLK